MLGAELLGFAPLSWAFFFVLLAEAEIFAAQSHQILQFPTTSRITSPLYLLMAFFVWSTNLQPC